MNNTYFKNPIVSSIIKSPIQNTIDIRDNNHPVRKEISKLCGTFNFSVTFEEDIETFNSLSNQVPGIVAILCTLSKDNQVIAYGRSLSVFSNINKYVSKTISSAINGAFLSATNNATKLFESLNITKSDKPIVELATDKQKNYLKQLLEEKETDEDVKERWFANFDTLTKEDASDAIKQFCS